MLGRYRYYFGVGQTVFPFFYEVFELGLVLQQVDFVYEEYDRNCFFGDPFEELRIFVGSFDDIGYVEQNVGIGEGRLREIEHRLLQLVVRRENTRRIGIDDLHIVGIYDTHDAVAGRLGFGGNDRNPLSDERIHQC